MKICFYCHIDRPELLEMIDFYHQDIKILRKIDPLMKIATTYSEIDWSADIIFIWWWTYAFIPVIKALFLKKKVVITGTFNYRCPGVDRDYFRRPVWQRMLIKLATKFSKKNILVSHNEFQDLTKDWGFSNLVYLPHCVDTEKYCISPSTRENYFFTICGLDKMSVERKCLYELMEAIKLVSMGYPDVKLVVAGRCGNATDDVKEFVDQNNLQDKIVLLGEISEPEKIAHLQHCACYLQPSKYEGFGLAIAEAMSCGCNIMTSKVGEVPNVVGNCGYLLDSNTPSEIALAIDKMIGSKECNMSCRKRIVEFFPISRREKGLRDILSNL